MGYALSEMIGPAILLEHPNISKEEFVEILDNSGQSYYGKGLSGLASVLRLSYTDKFKIYRYYRRNYHKVRTELSPEFVYDFNQSEGSFRFTFGGKKYLWNNVDGKYSLDPKTYDLIGASLRTNVMGYHAELGYVDMVLTAEAVKHKTPQVLGRRLTYASLDGLFETHPESKKRYDRAVWDSHTSLFAKKEGMTVTELLRIRSLGSIYFS